MDRPRSERKSGWCRAMCARPSTCTTKSGTAAAAGWKEAGRSRGGGKSASAATVASFGRISPLKPVQGASCVGNHTCNIVVAYLEWRCYCICNINVAQQQGAESHGGQHPAAPEPHQHRSHREAHGPARPAGARVARAHDRRAVWRVVRPEARREFAAGETIRGRLVIPSYEHLTLELLVERIEPEHYFSYRWHPYAVDPKTDYSAEPTTLVEFRLEEQAGGTALTIIESGFDRIPLSRRAEAFRMNDKGWASQSQKLARYVEAQ